MQRILANVNIQIHKGGYMIDFNDYIRKNPEADVPDLEQLLDRIDYFFGDQTNDAAEQNKKVQAERKV